MTRRNSCLLLAASLLLGACVASPPPPKEVFYRFLPIETQPLPAPALGGSVRVERLKAEGILSERALLFSQAHSTGKLEQYRYHHWSEPPAHLLTQGLIHYLQDMQAADKVIAADIRTEVAYSIDGDVLRLERILDDGTDRVVLELALRLQQFSNRELVLQKRYLETVDVESDNMTDVINAFSQARQRIYISFAEDLKALPSP